MSVARAGRAQLPDSFGRDDRRPQDDEHALALTPGDHALPDEVDALGDVVRRERIYRRLLAFADCAAVLVALPIVSAITQTSLGLIALCAVPFVIVVAKLQRLYDRDELVIFKSTITELPRLFQVAVVVTVALDLSRGSVGHGRSYGLVFSAVLCSAITVLMFAARGLARHFARRTSPEERCLIIGDSSSCDGLGQKIDELRGVSLIGAVSTDDVIESETSLGELVHLVGAQRLVIAPSSRISDDQTLDLVRRAKATGARVSIFPSIMAAVGGSVVFDDFAGYTLLGVPRFGLSRSSATMKRSFDLIGATLGLVVLSPVLLISALLIRLDTRGPIIFRQDRVGRNGNHFAMFKFRSMIDGADEMKKDLLHRNEAESGLFKMTADPRVTRVGRWLRRTRLDELPQLVNVVRGEMSLVGPRPLIAEEDQRVVGLDRRRLHLTPGVTGPWQILGPMRVPLAEMAKLDYLYIANWSLWRDIEILLKTFRLVFDRNGL